MGELKRGWRRVRFGEIVHHIAERVEPCDEDNATYIGLEHMESGSLRVRRWGSPTALVGTKLRMRKGDILFARRNAYLRRVSIAPHDGLFSAHGMVLRAKSDMILPEFLPFFMRSDAFMERAEQISVGSLSPTINWSALREEEFELPPMDEQRRHATVLQRVADVTEQLRDAATIGSTARDALIVDLYQRGTRGETLISTVVGAVPSSWSVEPLGNRYSIQLGKMMSASARTGDKGGANVPYIRNANVQWNRLELNDVSSMFFTEVEREKFAIRPGDILACEGRHVGKSAIWRNEIPGACYQKALHRLRARRDDVPEFLLHYLYFLSITGRFAALTGETTIPHLPAEKLRAMEIAFPPVDEQKEIAKAIDAFDSGLEALKERASRGEALMRVLSVEAA